jgi:hypothetical protein
MNVASAPQHPSAEGHVAILLAAPALKVGLSIAVA